MQLRRRSIRPYVGQNFVRRVCWQRVSLPVEARRNFKRADGGRDVEEDPSDDEQWQG